MENEMEMQGIFLFNYKLFLFALLLVPLYSFNNKYVKLVGILAILVLLVALIFDSIRRLDNIKINKIFMWFLIFTSYSIFQLVRTPTLKGLYSFSLQTLLLFFITMFSTIKLDNSILNKIFKAGKFIYILMLIPGGLIALEGGRGAFGKFDFLFSPVLYKIMLPCTFFFIAESKNKLFKVLIFSFIYLRMVERASSLSLLIIYIAYIILSKIINNKKLYKLLFVCTFLILFAFVYIYINLQYTNIGLIINGLFRRYTGGNFFSGRNIIWSLLFDYIKLRPIVGYGMDNNVLALAGITKSSHNTYIHLLLQGGLLSLILFFMIMYNIWKRFFHYLYNDTILSVAAYTIGTLAFINFEVTLIGNSTVTAIFYWLVLGIGLAKCNSIEGMLSNCSTQGYKGEN